MASLAKLAPGAFRLLRGAALRRGGPGEPPPAPPNGRVERAVAFVAHMGLRVSLLISAALILGLLAIGSAASWLAWLKLALGLILVAEGFLLTKDWRGARRLALWRIRRGESVLGRRFVRRLASPALQLLGLVWLAVGALAAIEGVTRLV